MNWRKVIGYWLTGIVAALIVGTGLGALIWSVVREETQHLEGGWTRVVTDNSTPFVPMAWSVAILAALWTVGTIIYYLLLDTSTARR